MKFEPLHFKDFATLGSAAFGFLAIMFTTQSYASAVVLIGVAAVLDVLDGFLARKSGKANGFGRELDSLADAVAFGAAPAFMVFWPSKDATWAIVYAVGGVVFLTAAIVRLARYNLYSAEASEKAAMRKGGKRVSKSVYYGLPAPAAALALVVFGLFFSTFAPAAELVLAGLMLAGFEIKKPF
ncbi:CDP-alcohol phosphatidyltransferase family protein [Candidatus Micrarchaeota archaeon]|nr:CDP-alcohol phosphatidyltransferase family protein [Candidatus Micrarchaeota archaeon]